jgi:hypothetical protein
MGATPSHPELLDWLAAWFRDEAHGSLRALHKVIVTSVTYQQASNGDDTAAAADPDNRLLWRMNRPRLDADTIRDAVLVVSGRLDATRGGPGIAHFKSTPGPQSTPVLDYAVYDWSSGGAGRPSIYRVVWRGIADPFMEAVDFPDLGLLAPTRGFSASPLQALAMFNNEFMLAHSEFFAQRLEKLGNTTAERIDTAFRLALQRKPDTMEASAFTALAEKRGLPAACRVIFNTNEFLFLD